MPSLSADTSGATDARYRALLRQATPSQLLGKTFSMMAMGRELAEMGVRHRFPKASDSEVRRRVFELFYRRDFSPEQLLKWERRLGLLENSDPLRSNRRP